MTEPATSTSAIPTKLFGGLRARTHTKTLLRELETVETELAKHLQFASPVADAPVRYLLAAGGKRLRPLLTLLVSEYGTGPNERVRLGAQLVEIIHLASLYHDDVMDEATLRRGVPAAHTAWSNSVAILAGDLLFARASSLTASMGEQAISLQAKTFERLCLGQLHETLGPSPDEDHITHYLQVLADKTGALISCATQLGLMFSNAPAEYQPHLSEYGESLGIAFQLIDDVIDLSPQKQKTGKLAGTDLRAGVVTMPLLLLRERVRKTGTGEDAKLLARIEAGQQQIRAGENANLLDEEVQQLQHHEVTELSRQAARDWSHRAVTALKNLPANNTTNALHELAKLVVDREG